jgi:dienelactone hydrolase
MSGRFSLAMLTEHPEIGLAGYVPIAPVGTDTVDRGPDAPPVSALILYGEDDDAYTDERAARLVEQLGADPADVVVIADGSHAAYDDEPEAFLDALLPFLAGLEGDG